MGALLTQAGSTAALLACVPSLRYLSSIDVSWQHPSAFFESLPFATPGGAGEEGGAQQGGEAADGAPPPPPCGLTSLLLCLNSPGAPALMEQRAAEWACLSQDGHLWSGPHHACALSHVVHQASCLSPPLPPPSATSTTASTFHHPSPPASTFAPTTCHWLQC